MIFHLFNINGAITSYLIITTSYTFYWNENFDYALMDILKGNWDSPLEFVTSLFNTSYNIYIVIFFIFFKNSKSYSILINFFTNNTNVLINEILFNLFTSISLTIVLKIPIQMEHSHMIIEPNVTHTHTHTLIGHFMTTIFLNY
jgi:hypothetical protein